MDQPPSYACSSRMRSEDSETASIRSAAPSYASAAPSYTSMLPPTTGPSPPNPKARHYHSVASRRASKQAFQEQSSRLLSARNGDQGVTQMRKRMEEEELERIKRTSEDPELVGEVAAKEHRRRREDLLLMQINGWERDKSWKNLWKNVEAEKQGKLA
ncbi:hypothetical protein QTJ16_006048 [Diplocarpon rosae]|uniref:Uncharacterized protein n=1 Tax=Diplocarpon rosae TaxID=946125 RepID=A0AAD9WB25_9HELO|nr:hypothetical protein QTJ16_006048 [Diplocarpon rosae]